MNWTMNNTITNMTINTGINVTINTGINVTTLTGNNTMTNADNSANDNISFSCELMLGNISDDSELITSSTAALTITCIFLSAISLFTVVANVIVIVAVVGTQLRERSMTTHLVTSMAVTDALLGAVIMPLVIYETANNGIWAVSPSLCQTRLVTDIVLCVISIFHVTSMSVERFLAVCKPNVYRNITMKTTYLMMTISWVCPPVVVIPIVVIGRWHAYGIEDLMYCLNLHQCVILMAAPVNIIIVSIVFYAPLITIIIIYSLILKETRAIGAYPTRKIAPQVQNRSTSLPEETGKPSTSYDVKNSNINRKETRINMKAVKTIGRLILCFTICWLPFHICITIMPYVDYNVPSWLMMVLTWLGYINSAINPLLYCYQGPVKSHIMSLLCPNQYLERRRNELGMSSQY